MTTRPTKILGVFPAMDSVGGVQASGRDAWLSIADRFGNKHAQLSSYRHGRSRFSFLFRTLAGSYHANILLFWHLQLARMAPFIDSRNARIITFLHGIEAWRKQDSLTHWALCYTNLFLSNSEYTWERFVSFNPHFRNATHAIVHLGAGGRLSGPTPDPANPPVALMVGRLRKSEDYKGHRQMIESWPIVLERMPQAQLWIVGDGDLRPDLEKLAFAKGVACSVRFWGSVSDAEKEALIAKCRCLVMPSRGEGFGLVYLEAMRTGRPCLVSRFDAGREVVNPPEAGLAVDPGNLQEVAEATCRLLSATPEWSQWSVQAQRRYESYFTAGKFQDRLLTAIFEN